MTILGIIAVLIQLALAIVSYLSNKGQLELDISKQLSDQLSGVLSLVQKAQAARQTVRDRVATDPSSVRQPTTDDRPYDSDTVG